MRYTTLRFAVHYITKLPMVLRSQLDLYVLQTTLGVEAQECDVSGELL